MQSLFLPNKMSEERKVDEDNNFDHLFSFSGANKAGMEKCDKEKQARVIYEMSKGSAYFKEAEKKDKLTDIKVQSLRKTFDIKDENQLAHMKLVALNKTMEYERQRNFDRICCVLDMDMFFAAVEIRDKPHLRDLPVAVGSDMMISTANYVARQFGVRSAMPGFIAKKLCPQLVFVSCNFEKYEVVSNQIRGIIGEYDPHFRSHSLDEVYFDLTNAAKERSISVNSNSEPLTLLKKRSREDIDFRDTESAADNIIDLRKHSFSILQEIRRRIKDATGGLTCSAGIANNFFLAKICADKNKPDGQFELPPSRSAVMEFMEDLPTRKVGGIGKVSEKILEKLGMRTMGEVHRNIHKILHSFTPKTGEFLARVCLGIGEEEGADDSSHSNSSSSSSGGRKSLGCERTFPNMRAPSALFSKLHELCNTVSAELVEQSLWGHTVTLKLKTSKFALYTRSASAVGHSYFQAAEAIFSLAQPLLQKMLPLELRLMGVSVSNFKNNSTTSGSKISDYFLSSGRSNSSDGKIVVPDYENEPAGQDEGEDEDILSGDVVQEEVDKVIIKEDSQENSSAKCEFECPVCSAVKFSSLRELNRHIDICLNATFLSEENLLLNNNS